MIATRILSYIKTYYLWLYLIGFVALVVCLREMREAQKKRTQTIFALERELAAAHELRVRTYLILIVASLVVLALTRLIASRSHSVPPLHEPTPTQMIYQIPTAVPQTSTPTVTRIPTRPRPTQLPPTETPTPTQPPPPTCPNPGICITSPSAGQVLKGQVTIHGTAQIEAFQFYKMEYGQGANPQAWHSIGEPRHTAVTDGTLGVWDATGFPAGVYQLRLTVVNISGNFPPPYEVQVIIQP